MDCDTLVLSSNYHEEKIIRNFKNNKITKLSLAFCETLPENDLIQILSNNKKKILALDLSGLNLKYKLIKKIFNIHNLKSLSKLSLSGNKLGVYGAKLISTLTNLSYLDLSHNQIGNKGLKYFANHENLVNLDVSNNHICGLGIKYLGKKFSIHEINLASNDFLAECCEYFINLKIEKIDLQNNKIGNLGAKYLSKNKYFKKLYLNSCQIGNKGLIFLSNNKNLKEIYLHDNEITEISCYRNNKNLFILSVQGNPITEINFNDYFIPILYSNIYKLNYFSESNFIIELFFLLEKYFYFKIIKIIEFYLY